MPGNVIHSSAEVSSPSASIRGQIEHPDRLCDPVGWEMLPEDQRAWWHLCAKHHAEHMTLPSRRRPAGTGLRLLPSGWRPYWHLQLPRSIKCNGQTRLTWSRGPASNSF